MSLLDKKVIIKNTGTTLDGCYGFIKGVATHQDLVQNYIIDISLANQINNLGLEYPCIVLPNVCFEFYDVY